MMTQNKIKLNQLCRDILYVIACSSAAEREDLNVLSPSYKYVSNMVSKMIDNGLIAYMRNDAKILRLTKNGLNYLRENDTPLYKFYMKMTNDGQAGHSQRHKELMIKTAGAQASMLMAGIDIGPQKPSLIDIRQNAAAKMNIEDQPTFYMGKEIKYQTGQKVSRSHLSRASGVLFSQGTTALVYNTVDSSIKISTAVENETAMLARVWSAELYNQYLPPGVSIYDSIVMCRGDDVMLSVMENCIGGKSTMKMMGDTIKNIGLTNRSTRYIPISEDGILSLQLISTYTRTEIKDLLFTKAEQEAVPAGYTADAFINGLLCFEFLSCNVTKLAYVKSKFPDMKWERGDVGIVCWDGQADFVTRYFNVKPIRIRQYSKSAIQNFLKGE